MNQSLLYLAALTLLAFSVEASAMAAPISDPIGDTFGNALIQLDISVIDAIFTKTDLTFNISFFTPISPASAFAANSIVGIIDIDADREELTGVISGQSVFAPPPPSGLGIEFFVDLLSEARTPGFVEIIKSVAPARGEVIGSVPILFTPKSLSVKMSLAMLGNDDGLINYGIVVGTFSEGTDEAPNSPIATSHSIPEPSTLIGLLGFGLMLGSRRLLSRS